MTFDEFAIRFPFLGDHIFAILVFAIGNYYILKHNFLLKQGLVSFLKNVVIEASFYFILFVLSFKLIELFLKTYQASIIASVIILIVGRLHHVGRPVKFWD